MGRYYYPSKKRKTVNGELLIAEEKGKHDQRARTYYNTIHISVSPAASTRYVRTRVYVAQHCCNVPGTCT